MIGAIGARTVRLVGGARRGPHRELRGGLEQAGGDGDEIGARWPCARGDDALRLRTSSSNSRTGAAHEAMNDALEEFDRGSAAVDMREYRATLKARRARRTRRRRRLR